MAKEPAGHPALDGPAKPIDPEMFLSREGKAQNMGKLRGLMLQYHGTKDTIGLLAGVPAPETLPFESMTIRLADGGTLHIPAKELAVGQEQYVLPGSGLPAMQQWAAAHVQELHSPPLACAETVVVGGASHGLDLISRLLLERGDCILTEALTYPQVLDCLAVPQGFEALPVDMDGHGICPNALKKVLAARMEDTSRPFPKLLYTIPTAQNPTGVTTPLERRQEIYAICRANDLLILEDDPYFYLQFPEGEHNLPGLRGLPRRASYLSLDVDGRVLRLDSMAKFLATGLRLAWVTAHADLARQLARAAQGSSLGACGLTQAIAARLLADWGEAGLHDHLLRVQGLYARRGAALHAAATEHLAGLAEWQEPTSGMFMWIKILGVKDALDLTPDTVQTRVVVPPGTLFHTGNMTEHRVSVPYLRLCFSYETEDNMREATRRLGEALRLHQSRNQQAEQGV